MCSFYFVFYLNVKLNYVQFLVGPALVTTKDAGDAVTLLQSLAGSTFDSSQLVLTACMGYPNVNEARLKVMRNKHRPTVRAAVEERSNGLRVLRDSQGLASKLYGFKKDPGSLIVGTNKTDQVANKHMNGDLSRMNSGSINSDDLSTNMTGDVEIDSVPDLQEQVPLCFFLYHIQILLTPSCINFAKVLD